MSNKNPDNKDPNPGQAHADDTFKGIKDNYGKTGKYPAGHPSKVNEQAAESAKGK